mmetsp:Transcript_37678/g.72201  ORF Transcript_37678/g.72201 Transcript_37678/m.72201 type:complete len:84 (-) Transcript_37678:440-691(-)
MDKPVELLKVPSQRIGPHSRLEATSQWISNRSLSGPGGSCTHRECKHRRATRAESHMHPGIRTRRTMGIQTAKVSQFGVASCD